MKRNPARDPKLANYPLTAQDEDEVAYAIPKGSMYPYEYTLTLKYRYRDYFKA